MARPPKPQKPNAAGRPNAPSASLPSPMNAGVYLTPAMVRTIPAALGDQVLLPPPPHILRNDSSGRPTQAQVDYDTRISEFSKKLAAGQNDSNSRIDRLETTVGDSSAGIVHEIRALTDGQTALSQEVTTLTATVGSNDASIRQELTALASTDASYAAEITTIKSDVNNVSGQITSERSLRINGDTALGTRIDNLVVSSGNNAAVIIDTEAQARISADNALGVRIDSVTATVGDNTAAIAQEITARADADSALAQQINTISATAGDRIYLQTTAPANIGRDEGDLWLDSDDGNKPYWWNGSSWLPVTDARIPNLYSLVSTETQARIDADALKADASTVTNLASTVGAIDGRVGAGVAGSTITAALNTKASQSDLTTQANRITNLDSKVGAGISGSTITEKLNTTANDTSTNASAITTLNSTTIPGINTRIGSAESAIKAVDDKVGAGISGSTITQKLNTTANDTATNASSITSLTSRVGSLENSSGNTANLTAAIQTATDQNGASYLWSIRGTANTTTGAITLKGGQTVSPDGTKTQYSKLIIDADTDINGALTVANARSSAQTTGGLNVMVIDFNNGTIVISD